MDFIDKKILELLSGNADISATDLGNAVNLSIPAINKRIAKLKKEKVIRSFTITTDPKQVSKPIIAFILIVMRFNDGIDAFLDQLCDDVDVLECYAITGEYDYIVKVCARNVEELEDKLLYLKRQKGVLKSHTMLSLMEHKFSPTVLP